MENTELQHASRTAISQPPTFDAAKAIKEKQELEVKVKIVERTNGRLIREIVAAKSELLDLRRINAELSDLKAAKAVVEAELEAEHKEHTASVCAHREEVDALREQLAEKNAQIARSKSRVMAPESGDSEIHKQDSAALVEIEDQLRSATVSITEKDGIIAQLRDKLQTARFALEEREISRFTEKANLVAELDTLQRERRNREGLLVGRLREMEEDLLNARYKAAAGLAASKTLERQVEAAQSARIALEEDLIKKERDIECLHSQLEKGARDGIVDLEVEGEDRREVLAQEREQWAEERQQVSIYASFEHRYQSILEEWEMLTVQLLDLLAGVEQDEEHEVATLRQQVEVLSQHLVAAQQSVQELYAGLEGANDRLETKESALLVQREQIEIFRQNVAEAEDLHARTIEAGEQRAKDAERIITRLRQETEELQREMESQSTALKEAITEKEVEKSRSSDVRSRLEAYLAEIDRLKIIEAQLSAKIEDMTTQSANDDIDKLEMSKRLAQLEEDKELLNIALESKQHELVLLQRHLGHSGRSGSVTPKPHRLTASASRIPPTPWSIIDTPLPRRLSISTTSHGSLSTIKASRRETSFHTPSVAKPTFSSNNSVARPTLSSITKATPTPALGASTRHNRTSPEKVRPSSAVGKAVGGGSGGGGGSEGGKGLKRQSSLPVLVRRPSSAIGMGNRAGTGTGIGIGVERTVPRLIEEEEVVVDAIL